MARHAMSLQDRRHTLLEVLPRAERAESSDTQGEQERGRVQSSSRHHIQKRSGCRGRPSNRDQTSRQRLLDDMSFFDTGQSLIESQVRKAQPRVIKPEQVQNRGMQITDMAAIYHGFEA